MEPLVTALREWFAYDPIRGILIRLRKTRSDAYDEIDPYRPTVYFQGRDYDYGTVCWIIYHGRLPRIGCIIDHANTLKIDHKIDNLREATPAQNQQNKSGYGRFAKGVSCRFEGSRTKPFQARIRVGGVRILLGSFATEEEAAEAYKQAAIKYHGEFARYD